MFVFVEFNGESAKAVAMTLVVLFCSFSLFLFLFSYFPSSPALYRYLVFVLFRPCSSYLFLFTYVVLSAFLLFLRITYFRTPVGVLSFSAICRYLLPRPRVVSSVQQLSVPPQHVCSCSHSYFILFLVWLVLLCSRTRYASISLTFP